MPLFTFSFKFFQKYSSPMQPNVFLDGIIGEKNFTIYIDYITFGLHREGGAGDAGGKALPALSK